MTISCTFANAEETQVHFTDNLGGTYTVPVDWPGRFREEENDGGGVVGFIANGGSIGPYVAPPTPFKDLPRPSFLFMMSKKIGITETQVERLIGQMPEGDARDLALIVFKNQQTFKRDNALLSTLTSAAGLTPEQVDTAWRAAEQLTW
jgi:hypothetical protein